MLNDCDVGPGFIGEPPFEPHPLNPKTESPASPIARTTKRESNRRRLRQPTSRKLGRRIAAATFEPATRDAVAVTATTAAPVAESTDGALTLHVTVVGALQENENAPRKFPTGTALTEKSPT